MGRLCFDTCLSVCPPLGRGVTPARSGQGVPQPGGTCPGYPPGQVRTGGTHPRYPPGQVRTGVTPDWGVATPLPLARSGQGVPQLGGPTWGKPPPPPQHMEYLISGGRYASCVHAGGLSCSE